jgi:hypothetical protein
MPASLFVNDLLVTMNVKIRLYSNEIFDLNSSYVIKLDAKVHKAKKDILSLELTIFLCYIYLYK